MYLIGQAVVKLVFVVATYNLEKECYTELIIIIIIIIIIV